MVPPIVADGYKHRDSKPDIRQRVKDLGTLINGTSPLDTSPQGSEISVDEETERVYELERMEDQGNKALQVNRIDACEFPWRLRQCAPGLHGGS